MNSCEKTILDLLSRALFGVEVALDKTVDWKSLYKEARVQTVLPLVYNALTEEEKAQIPSEIGAKWKQAFLQSVVTNEQVLYEQEQVINLLNQHEIPCVILKGKGSALNYPDPSLRVLGDIDLLVAPENVEKTSQLLMQDGFEEKEDGDLHRAFHKEKIIVELHKKPLSLGFNESNEIEQAVQAFFADIIEKRQIVDGTPIPSYAHQAIILLMHKLTHFLNGELGLRQLCDWAVFVKSHLDENLWRELSPILDEFGIKTFTVVITRVCIKYLGMSSAYAEWALDCDDVLVKDVIELIVESGNFGGKVENSYGQRLFVDAHSKNRISSFFKVLWKACRTHWPVCDRHPILLPVAPVVVYFKYLKMRKQGKRKKLKLSTVYQRAGTRQKLYQELQPFVRRESMNTET